MDANHLLKEKEREKDREKDKEKRSKLNNSAHILTSNNTNNNAHIKQRNNIHNNSSNEATSPLPNEHVVRLEADIKRLKADLQVNPANQQVSVDILEDKAYYFMSRLRGSPRRN